MARTPTCPDDDAIGVPRPGDPSSPPERYDGRPSFATGAKEARSLEEAHALMRAGGGPYGEEGR